jgi:hypothetical protein
MVASFLYTIQEGLRSGLRQMGKLLEETSLKAFPNSYSPRAFPFPYEKRFVEGLC